MPTRSTVHVDKRLTSLSLAYKNQELVGVRLFPTVRVDKESDKYAIFGKENFDAPNAFRADGGTYNRLDWTLSDTSYNVEEYGYEQAIGDRLAKNADAEVELENTTTQFLTERLLLAQERRIASLVTTGGNFTNKVTLSGADQFSDDNSDPIGVFDTAKSAILSAVGMMPNVAIIPYATYLKLKEHPQILAKLASNERMQIKENGQSQILQDLLEVQSVVIAKSQYNTAKEGHTITLSPVWGDYIVIAYSQPAPARKQPSFGYCFEFEPRVTEVYRDETRRSDIIRVRMTNKEKLTSETAGYLISDAIA